MKAIFMTEVGGKLLEIDRREIVPTPVYYCAVREPVQMRALSEVTTQPPVMKRERWVAQSKPAHEKGFAVFLLDGIE